MLLGGVGVLLLVVGAGIGVATAPAPQPPASVTVGPITLSATPTTDLDPTGATVVIHGSGFDEAKGIYVAFCVRPAPGQLPSPCGGGIDTSGTSGASAWISSDPPPYGEGLAVPFGPGGSFESTLRIAASFGDVDCRTTTCAIVTRADHLRTSDRSQDAAVPVTFAAGPPPPIGLLLTIAGAALLGLGLLVGLAALVRSRRDRAVAGSATTLAVVAVTLGLLATGCGGATAAPSGAGAACRPVTATVDEGIDPIAAPGTVTPALPVSVASADGGTVTVTDASRILAVNLYGSIAEIVFSLGLGDRVVGRDSSTTFADAADLPLVTAGGHDLSAEAILRLDPTVILADESIGPPEVLAQLRSAGIPVVLLDDEQTLEHVPDHIRAVAGALGVADAGERLVARVQAQMADAAARIPAGVTPPRIAFLYLRGTAGVYLMAGDGAGPDAMIEGIGAVDAGSAIGLEGFRPITTEALIRAAPDVLLLMTGGLDSVGGIDGLLAQPGIAQTPAGAAHRIVDMDDGVLLNFGARTGRAMQALAEAVYDSCDPT